jgi:hypothetical protein
MAAASFALYAWNVRRWWFVGDDAFISFRYARNLVDGLGLVWNAGERVEGYTNFLWVLIAAAGMRLGIEPETLAPAIGAASGAAILLSLAWFSGRTGGWLDPWAWLAPLALSLSRSFTAWSTGGLETQLFALLVWLGVLAHLRERERGAPWPLGSAALFAAAALTRPEGALFAAGVGAFFLADVARGRRRFAAALAWGAVLAVVVGGHLLWRHAYYGFWLPNTFYAKVAGLWLEQSAHYFSLFHQDYRFGWFVPLVLAPVLVRRDHAHSLFAALLGAYLAYVVYIGGDRFEFRFLVVVFPFAYWLLGQGIRLAAEAAGEAIGRPYATPLAGTALAALLLAATHAGSVREEAAVNRHDVESVQQTTFYGALRIRQGLLLRQLIERGALPRDLPFATGGAGAVPYYTRWPTVDTMGLNDARLAHAPIGERGVIGHERRATGEYLRERGVVLIDFSNRIVVTRQELERDRERFAAFAWHTRDKGRMIAAHLDGQTLLLFRTMVSDDELARWLPGLRLEPLPG